MRLSASVTLTRQPKGADAVSYYILLTPPAVTVGGIGATVTPDIMLKAEAYRSVAGTATKATDGEMWMCLEYLDGSSTSAHIDSIKTTAFISCASAHFEYRVGGTVVARQPLAITRVGGTYQPLRIREWSGIQLGQPLYTGLGEDDPWTDLVFKLVSGSPVYYRVIKNTHRTDKDPSDPSYSGYLQQASDYGFIVTQIILAASAYIDCLASNGVRVYEAGALVAALVNGDFPLFLGAATAAAAPFKVSKLGKLFCRGADVAGSITADTLQMKMATVNPDTGAAGIPDGSLCFACSQITLPALPKGTMRIVKVFNPRMTRSEVEDMILEPQNSTVSISPTLNIFDAQSKETTVPEAGYNAGKYLELLGYNRLKKTYWITVVLSTI